MALPQSCQAVLPLHHRPWRENLWLSNIPVGSTINTSSWGLWVHLGIELGHISLRNEQKWLLLRFMSHLPSLVCIDGHGKEAQISVPGFSWKSSALRNLSQIMGSLLLLKQWNFRCVCTSDSIKSNVWHVRVQKVDNSVPVVLLA